MMKTGKNKRLLASILAASMLLAMSPFAFALAEGTEDTTNQTGQGQSQSTEGNNKDHGTTEGGGSGTTTGGTDSIEWNVSRLLLPHGVLRLIAGTTGLAPTTGTLNMAAIILLLTGLQG